MKTRRLLIIILIAALLAVYYLIGTDYLKQRNQKATLASQIAVETETLAQIPLPPADLEQRLADAQNGLDAAKNIFVVDLLLKLESFFMELPVVVKLAQLKLF